MDLRKRGVTLNMLQKERGSLRKGGVPTLEETVANHILRVISISNWDDLSYVFLYLIFIPFIFIDAIKTVTLFIRYTLCNNFIFIFNLEKVQSYRSNNLIQAIKVNAKL